MQETAIGDYERNSADYYAIIEKIGISGTEKPLIYSSISAELAAAIDALPLNMTGFSISDVKISFFSLSVFKENSLERSLTTPLEIFSWKTGAKIRNNQTRRVTDGCDDNNRRMFEEERQRQKEREEYEESLWEHDSDTEERTFYLGCMI